jgi:hypothetical protein
MSPIYLYNGKILTENNAIAVSEDCCCDEPTDEPPDVGGCQDQCQNYLILVLGGEPYPGFIGEIEGQGYTNITINQVDEATYEVYGDCCGELINLGAVVGPGGGFQILSCICEEN